MVKAAQFICDGGYAFPSMHWRKKLVNWEHFDFPWTIAFSILILRCWTNNWCYRKKRPWKQTGLSWFLVSWNAVLITFLILTSTRWPVHYTAASETPQNLLNILARLLPKIVLLSYFGHTSWEKPVQPVSFLVNNDFLLVLTAALSSSVTLFLFILLII